MRDTLTISIPRDLRILLDKTSRGEGVSRSDLVRESLQDFLFVHRFRKLRKKLLPKARQKGLFSDDDVFRRFS